MFYCKLHLHLLNLSQAETPGLKPVGGVHLVYTPDVVPEHDRVQGHIIHLHCDPCSDSQTVGCNGERDIRLVQVELG